MSDDVRAAAERLLATRGRSIVDGRQVALDIRTVAQAALDGEREVARLRAQVRSWASEAAHVAEESPTDAAAYFNQGKAFAFLRVAAALAAPTTAGGTSDPDSGGRGEGT